MIWISWENNRRTNELSRTLGVKVYKIIYKGNYLLKIIRNSFITIRLILLIKPDKIIVQNPSIILAALVCFLKDVLRFKLIVDRHSNFKLDTLTSKFLKYKIYHFLSRYTIKKADLTIVTNSYLKDVVNRWGGNGFVLQDKIPDLIYKKNILLKSKYNVIFPCSFNYDEPFIEVIEASKNILADSIAIYITGDYKKINPNIIRNASSNIVFTGFLDEKNYQSLIYSSDLLLALTTEDYTLLCSAYEGIAAQKPLILSNKKGLKEYFYKGVVLTENNPVDISQAIITAIKDYKNLNQQIIELSYELNNDWQINFNELQEKINKL